MSHPEEREPVVVKDNRKIDPVTGQARKPAAAPPPAPDEDVPKTGTDPAALLLEERTADLQRVQAEYANYRKRADRDRLAAGDHAVGRALTEMLPVLDDLDRAAAHGDLTGPLKAVADKLDAAFGKLGLLAFGEVGDPFDPARHEAVMHDESAEVIVPTCTSVLRKGYEHKDRLLRAAMVGVTDPLAPSASREDDPGLEGDVPASSEDDPGLEGDVPASSEDAPLEGSVAAEGEQAGTTAPPPGDEVQTQPEGDPTQEE